uniref:HMA domain-containing protein n=1 Tax=Kalanchoe fedtschenkoi TaxID=63787 RepID=A0A7N0V303_KALFE
MSPQQELLKIQTCVLKVSIHCQGCKRKVKKLLSKVEGVYAVEVDEERGRVTVSGTADPAALVKKLAKSGKRAELLELGKIQESKKNDLQLSTGSKLKIIQPGGDGRKVPKGMKEVKVVADQDGLEIGDNFSLLDGGGGEAEIEVEDVESAVKGKSKPKTGFRQGKPAKQNEGKSGRKASQQDGKKGRGGDGHVQNGKSKLSGGKAKSGTGGAGPHGVILGQGPAAAKIAQMGQMAQMPQEHMPYHDLQHNQHPMTAVMMNRPMMGGDGMYHHPMFYTRPDGPPLPPPPPAANPFAHIFSDENATGCSIM